MEKNKNMADQFKDMTFENGTIIDLLRRRDCNKWQSSYVRADES